MRAHAKINLFLHVGERRSDGYHELASLVAFAAAGDDLAAEPANEITLSVNGAFAASCPAGDDNLVLKAAHALAARFGLSRGARLTLTKNLPVASGIGGGSADAAAALRLLNDQWDAPASEDELARIAAGLGADVPVCLYGRSSIVHGIGACLEPGPHLPEVPIVLVNPGIPVPTAEIFRRLTIRTGARCSDIPDRFAAPSVLASWLLRTQNDLEMPARLFAPQITGVLAALIATKGCLLSRMSGSGATCFGIFESESLAAHAALVICAQNPNWWVAPTVLLGDRK